MFSLPSPDTVKMNRKSVIFWTDSDSTDIGLLIKYYYLSEGSPPPPPPCVCVCVLVFTHVQTLTDSSASGRFCPLVNLNGNKETVNSDKK